MTLRISGICFILALSATMLFTNSTASTSIQRKAILLTGQVAPGTGGGKFASFGQISLNDHSEIVFNAKVVDSQTGGGVFLYNASGTMPIALNGQQAPKIGGKFVGFRSPVINNNGDVLFLATITGSTTHSGLFLNSSGALYPIAWEGQVINGTDSPLLAFEGHQLSDNGEVTFIADIFSRDFGNSKGLFVISKGIIRPLVLPGSRDQDGAIIISPSDIALNKSGDLVFTDEFIAGPTSMRAGGAIYKYSQSTIVPVAKYAQLVANTSGSLSLSLEKEMHSPSINSDGLVAFTAAAKGQDDTNGIFVFGNTSNKAVVLKGMFVDGTSNTFEAFLSAKVNDTGALLFNAIVSTGANDLASRFIRGWFVFKAGTISQLLLTGQPTPETGGGVMSKADDAAINSNNAIALVVRISGGPCHYAIILCNYSDGNN